MACCYMQLSHFRLALQALEDAFEISDKNSQLLFRRAQVKKIDDFSIIFIFKARLFNKDSNLTELALAKKDIELAIEMRRYEKIFQAEPGILKILNISNAEEIYIETAHLVEKKIKERKEFEADAIKCEINKFFSEIR